MTRKYSLVIEGDAAGYGAYVPELPTILVTGQSMEEHYRPRQGGDSALLGHVGDEPLTHFATQRD
ncbi:MAG: hypothetical protein LAP40_27855 [Acidobacteriia bacterium]|nr:hypothetical protein [Terriglobia bacterium]